MTISHKESKAEDLQQGEMIVITNIFKAAPFPAPQVEEEPSTGREQDPAVGQAGLEGMEGHRDQPEAPGMCDRHSPEGMSTLLTLTALPGQG